MGKALLGLKYSWPDQFSPAQISPVDHFLRRRLTSGRVNAYCMHSRRVQIQIPPTADEGSSTAHYSIVLSNDKTIIAKYSSDDVISALHGGFAVFKKC